MDIKSCFDSISGQNNNPKIEKEYREACSSYESHCSASNSTLSQDYLKYIDLYNRKTSLYAFSSNKDRSEFIIYDTENQRKEVKILDTSEKLNQYTCVTQLPCGQLFCFGNQFSGPTLIVDNNYFVKALPSGPPCGYSSGIYFSDNIYCFGGINNKSSPLTLSRKFDLTANRWSNFTPMRRVDFLCHSVLVNRNILVSGFYNRNLLLYSIDIDSFSTIPYVFSAWKQKILINAERLYLIEFEYGLIYESEDEYNWQQISRSIIAENIIVSYCTYNKGGVYIIASIRDGNYFKFDLDKKDMIKLYAMNKKL